MFSLRRFPIRSCKVKSIVPQCTTQQGPIASRALSSIAINRPARIAAASPTPSLSIQRRRFSTDEDEGMGPRVLGLGTSASAGGLHRGPDGRPLKATSALYVGNLQFDVTEDILRQHFDSISPVKSVKIIYDARGMSKGFGYIDYGDVDTATRALEAMHDSLFAGRRLNVQYVANPQNTRTQPNPPSKTLFIGNMNFEMTDNDINELFRDIQGCLDIRVAMDRRTGRPRGFAHADFASIENAIAAKQKLENRLFFGRALRIDFSSRSRDEDGRLQPQDEPINRSY